MKKFGIAVDEDMLEEIERPMEYGDRRSDRIRELLRLGLATEQAFERVDGASIPESDRELNSLMFQLLREHMGE